MSVKLRGSVTPRDAGASVSGSALSSSGVPSNTVWPFTRITTRSATAVTSDTLLSTSSVAMPLCAHQAHGVPDLRPDERREAFGRLVEDQHARVGQQRARDREHLLLAAGELVAAIAQALAEPRKQF